MVRVNIKYILKIAALCVIAAALNRALSLFAVFELKIPLFIDTIFTAAVTFCAGLIPGLVTAFLTWVLGFVGTYEPSPFLICSIAEVLIIWWLKPSAQLKLKRSNDVRMFAENISVLARLMLLYIAASITVSALGGLVDYIFFTVLPNSKAHISAEDVYKAGIQQNLFPVPVMNTLSRLPINLVDRFIVIFGGYFISILVGKYLLKPIQPKTQPTQSAS